MERHDGIPRITERQRQVLVFIEEFRREHPYGPTIREVQGALGLAAVSNARFHLMALQRKGLVVWEPWLSRTLRIVEQAQRKDGER